MQPEDRKEFNVMMVTAMAVYERQITGALADLYFAALGPYTLQQVSDGFARHLQDPVDGKFSPKPADIIRQIQGVTHDDRRPGKDIAWSMAMRSLDDLETVVLTDEILAAREMAMPLLEIRDKVAARLAFVEAYEKQVDMARRSGKPINVFVSLGDDKARRAPAVEEAVRSGLLTQEQASPHLLRIGQETQPISDEGAAIAGLLAGPAGKPTTSEERQRKLDEVRSQIGIGARGVQAEKSMAEALERRADTERRKRAVKEQIQGKNVFYPSDKGPE